MASLYLRAMNHQEWNSKKVLKKHFMNRPLRRIEDYHSYRPAQPVLSCRTINIDLNGSRTYRAKSTRDIIDEQHKLIHSLYTGAKNVSSAPVRRPTSPRNTYSNSLSSLNVRGARPGTSPAAYKKEPPTYQVPSRWDKRPKSSGIRPCDVLPDGSFRQDEISASKVAFQKAHEQVHYQWNDPSRPYSLEDGIFVKGKNSETSLEKGQGSKSKRFGSNWAGSGVSATITSSSNSETGYYNSNDYGRSSTVYAQYEEYDNVESPSRSRSCSGMSSNEGRLTSPPPAFVPLCWDDQLERYNAKVLCSRGAQRRRSPPNFCETNPVVFSNEDGSRGSATSSLSSTPRDGGYRVVSRKKNRKGVGGTERSNGSITSVTIENDAASVDDIELSYEDILDMNIKSMTPDNHTRDLIDHIKSNSIPISLPKHTLETDQELAETKQPHTSSGETLEHSVPVLKEIVRNGDSRPQTSHSRLSIDTASEIDLAVTPRNGKDHRRSRAPQSRPVTGSNSRIGSSTRLTSAGRPVPQKPSLHKTSAATGASISSSKLGSEKEYIHFTQHIASPDEGDAKGGRNSASGSNTAAIRSISDHNIAHVEASDKQEDSTNVSQIAGGSTPSVGSITSPRVLSDDIPTPHPSPRQEEPEVKYAFNIPTADMSEAEYTEQSVAADEDEKSNEEVSQTTVTVEDNASTNDDILEASEKS